MTVYMQYVPACTLIINPCIDCTYFIYVCIYIFHLFPCIPSRRPSLPPSPVQSQGPADSARDTARSISALDLRFFSFAVSRASRTPGRGLRRRRRRCARRFRLLSRRPASPRLSGRSSAPPRPGCFAGRPILRREGEGPSVPERVGRQARAKAGAGGGRSAERHSGDGGEARKGEDAAQDWAFYVPLDPRYGSMIRPLSKGT